jgi:Ankyrin repeat
MGILGGRNRSSNMDKQSRNRRRVPPLLRLLKRRDFDTIIQLLKDPNANVEKWFDSEYNLMGENALHLVMRYSPPASLVSAMTARLQDSGVSLQPELTVDLMGRTPLHHACEAQCEPAVIHALLETSAGAISARAKDVEGRLPLHLLCRGYNLPRIRKKQSAQQERAAMLAAMSTSIKLLVGLSPRTACIRDDRRRTALDYVNNLKMETGNDTCRELWEGMKLELSIAMDLSSTTTVGNLQQAGMVIKFSTECTDSDDISILSCPGGI